jgi:hypothetical protein
MRDFPGRKLLFSLGNRLIFLYCCLPACLTVAAVVPVVAKILTVLAI